MQNKEDMLTITYKPLYESSKEYIIILTNENYPNQHRKARLMCPGAQYLPAIKRLFYSRGFNVSIIEKKMRNSAMGLGAQVAPSQFPIKFYKGEPIQDYSEWYSKIITCIPWYIEARGKKILIDYERHSTGSAYDETRYRSEIAKLVRQLRRNGYSYFTRYSRHENPLELLKWVEENSYTFESFSKVYEHDGVTHFHGNLVEYSAAFSYVILDDELAEEISRQFSAMPKHAEP